MATTFTCHGHTPGSISEVWAALADYRGLARWAREVDHSTLLTDRAQGVGTVRRVQLGRTVLTEHVTRWDDGTALAYEVRGMPPAIESVEVRWDLTAHDDHTDVEVTVTLEPANPAGRALVPVLRRRLARSYLDMIDDLSNALALHEAAVAS